jgi:hypothetical protein
VDIERAGHFLGRYRIHECVPREGGER